MLRPWLLLWAALCAAAEVPQLAAAEVPQLAACANAEVWEFGTHKTPVAAAGYHLTVWSPASPPPSTPSANATVLLFVTGFGATVGASAYSHAMCAIATGGGNGSNPVVVVVADLKKGEDAKDAKDEEETGERRPLLGAPDYTALGALLAGTTVPFLRSKAFRDSFLARPTAAAPDAALSNLAVGGHSAGNHIAVRALAGPDGGNASATTACSGSSSGGSGFARAVVLIDPVDGVDRKSP